MFCKNLAILLIALSIHAIGITQKYEQKLAFLKNNITIYYIANPNVESPDIRSIKPSTIAESSNGIIFGATSNNGMDYCAQLLMSLFSDKGDKSFQYRVYTNLQKIKKPIVVNIINDAAAGIEDKYRPKYNLYLLNSAGRYSVWPGAYSDSKSGVQPSIVIGEYMSIPMGMDRLKETFVNLVTKLAAGEFGAAVVAPPNGGNSYHIVSAVGNKFLTVKGANTDNGATLEIHDFIGSDLSKPAANQVWTLQQFGEKNRYFIKSRQGRVLDLKDANAANGTPVQLWTLFGDSHQTWHLISAGDGFYYIQNLKSGKMLDVSGGIDQNGTKVQNYQWNKSISQKWKFVKIQGPNNSSLLTGEPTYCEKETEFTQWEVDLSKFQIGYCPQKQEEWEAVVSQQLGISAKNRTRHYIGWSAADKPALVVGHVAGRNWYPRADYKKVHVGKLCEVGFFDAVGETAWPKSWMVDRDEKDFNLHVMPSAPFRYQIDKSIIGFDPGIEFAGFYDCDDNWVKCGADLVMEGEITPDDAFLSNGNNPWLGNKNYGGSSTLFLNQNVGLYGPWIVEEVHCNHPEIHPVEMLWSETSDPNVKYLCLFQDDSDRFGYYSNFPDYTDAETMYQRIPIDKYKKEFDAAKAKVNPWAPAPISGQFYVAFQIDPSSATKLNYTISVETSREVVTSAAASKIGYDEYGSNTKSIKRNGVELLKVTELQSNKDDIGVRFELFKKKNSEIILGYMVISAAVSRDLDGKEGYMVIKLTKQ